MDKGSKGRYYEGCGKEGPILCIFICEFHSTYGPKISCQVPKDYISKEKFESVNVYLIPKPQLIRSIITVTLDDIKIVGYPVRIESQVYPRNAFYYNLCFICDSWARTVQYDQVVKDFSAYLRQLEEDERFLSKMEETEPRVCSLLSQVLQDLNTARVSSLQQGKRSVRLKVGKPTKVEVPSHSVPLLADAVDFRTWQHWDQSTLSTINKIIQHVDGLNHVEKIANLSNVEINQVKLCLQNLINDSVVKLVAQYRDTDCYLVTSGIRKLVLDKHLQADCVSRVSVQGGGSMATVRDIIKIYSSFNLGATVKDICLRYDVKQMKIDERKLIQFGLIHGLIRKLYRHVNYVPVDTGSSGVTVKEEHKQIYEKMDGKQSVEEIACDMNVSPTLLDHLIDSDASLFSLFK